MKLLDHENIIKINDIVSSEDGVSLVFDYFEHDLSGILQHPSVTLTEVQVKYILKMVLKALDYMHKRKIVHRDMKTSNILIGTSGNDVRLADFGLAKSLLHPDLDEPRAMTNRVVTLWYRPLEVLLGSTDYGTEIDMWGLGCILVEMFIGKPLFSGSSEISQIDAIVKRFSGCSKEQAGLANFPWAHLFEFKNRAADEPLDSVLDSLPKDAKDLAFKLLRLNPKERITAEQALRHPFFTSGERPSADLPKIDGDWHEFECKQRKKESVQASNK